MTHEHDDKVMAELAKIQGRLAESDAKLNGRLDRLEEKSDRNNEDTKAVKRLVDGNGEPERGIIVRLDRIEQSQKRFQWVSRTAIGAAITAIVGMFFTWLHK